MLQTKIPPGFGDSGVKFTVVDLLSWMSAEDIPLNANLQYAGCGTHLIELEWDDGKPEPDRVPNRMPAKLDDDEYWAYGEL